MAYLCRPRLAPPHAPAVVLLLLLLSASALPGVVAQPAGQDRRDAAPKPSPPSAAESRARHPPEAGAPTRPAEIELLVVYAQNAPDEFAADALIRIAESPRVADREWKRDLLEEAFRRASGAQYPLRRSYIGGIADTRPGYLSDAHDLRLDALSLKSRAVKALLAVDKERARALFAEIPARPKLEPLSCDDALAYNLSEFYATLAEVLNNTFSAEERRQNQHIQFLVPYLDGITSSAQVAPAAKAVVAAQLNPSQLSFVVAAFARALRNTPADDRSFSHAIMMEAATKSVVELADECRKKDVAAGELLKAYREYWVANLSAGRCADNVTEKSLSLVGKLLEQLNGALWPDSPLVADEIKPARVLGRAQKFEYWSTPEAKKLLMGVKSLRFGTGKTKLTDAEKLLPGWQTELAEYLNELESWGPGTEQTEADYFHQKCVLYGALVNIVPGGPGRDKVIGSLVEFLRGNFVQRESRAEWLWQANQLIRLMRPARGEGDAKVLERLSDSGDTNLRLYAELSRLLTTPRKTED